MDFNWKIEQAWEWILIVVSESGLKQKVYIAIKNMEKGTDSK